MKVILIADVKSLGKKGEIVDVNDGYARNFLFPKKMAVEANTENMAKLKGRNDSKQHKKDVQKQEALDISKKLENITLTLKVKAGENGKIFGGVTAKEVSEELNKQYQVKIDKKKIDLKENIKNLGTFTIEAKLYEGVIGKIKIHIISE